MTARSVDDDVTETGYVSRAAAVVERTLGCPVQENVEVLKAEGRKSLVLRLTVAVEPRRTVIVKRCPSAVAEREGLVYRSVLPSLGVSALSLYGTEENSDGTSWLVLEDAGDVAWSSESADHRLLASDWFGEVHVRALDLVASVALPARGTDYYRSILAESEAVLTSGAGNPAVAPDGTAVLRSAVASCERLESSWSGVEALADRFPCTLTLPGFGRKNVCVRPGTPTGVLLPFDFENAGWGPPAADLQHVDPHRYADVVSESWKTDVRDVADMAEVGRALSSLKSIPGERKTLTGPWPERAIRKILYYAASIDRALDVLAARGACAR